jgi:hypothetical protein
MADVRLVGPRRAAFAECVGAARMVLKAATAML